MIIRFLFLFCLIFSYPQHVLALDIMLPRVYRENTAVVGWLMSEKLDGVRGYWDGKKLFSKNGNLLYPPPAFTRSLPPFPLEGELWGGRGTFEKTVSIVKKKIPHKGWLDIQFAIFDVPQEQSSFSSRIQIARNWFTSHPSSYAFVIPQKYITETTQIKDELERIEKLGGEGLIVRNPDAPYRTGRSNDILKVKKFLDTEAVVIGYLPGKGRNLGRLGSLLVELIDTPDIRFKIGSGLSDAVRNSPPPIGTIITFKYFGFYESGLPRFPSFIRIRTDADLSR